MINSPRNPGMFAKYLRREKGFWRIKASGNQFCYCKHSAKYGGVYAYIEPGKNGVRIVTNGISRFFDDFNQLDRFLDKIEESGAQNFNSLVRTLHRATKSKVMRTLSL